MTSQSVTPIHIAVLDDEVDITQLLALPPVGQVCARLLSGDLNADGNPDDLNGDGKSDLQQVLGAIYGGSGGTGGGNPIGFPPVGGQR